MPWLKIDDRMPQHRKVRRLSHGGFRLYMTLLCLCARDQNDGHLHAEDIEDVLDSREFRDDDGDALVAELVERGLLDEGDTGMQVHDFTDYNPTKAKTEADRERNAARQQAWRDRQRGVTDAATTDGRNAVTNGDVTQGRNTVSNGAPSRPGPARPDPSPLTPTGVRRADDADVPHPQPELRNTAAVLASIGLTRNQARDFLAHLRSTGTRNTGALVSSLYRSGELLARLEEWRLVSEADAQARAAPTPGKRTTDDKVRDGLALAAKFAAEEAAAHTPPALEQIGA